MSPTRNDQVRRGEVWLARLDPVEGAEMGKSRPVVVISMDGMGTLPVKLVAPCTGSQLAPAPWRVPLSATAQNGLDRDTTIDLMQIRSISVRRLIHKLGEVDTHTAEDIAAMVAIIVEYE